MALVEVFVDGACSGNPGPGGYGIVVRQNGEEKTYSGAEAQTTNNRMELRAAIEALKMMPSGRRVDIYTDSEYVKKGMTEWLPRWIQRGWRNAKGEPVKNQDLWVALSQEVSRHDVRWHWVRGHNGHRENEMADELARNAILSLI